MAVTHLVVELHFIDAEPAWCNVCMLPSAVRITWVGAHPDTLATVVRGCSTFCTDCGNDELEP